jgi:3-hydroxymyristoyl/3-hydroxydecanoyl-(acyl carrier protein) dehydratase
MPLSTPQLAAEAAPAHAFAAFSFVDRIDEFEPSRRARGRFLVPAALAAFPACLVAEAVGQLAAWVAMDAVDFRGRPVAALAGETRFVAPVAPGSMLELAADIESCDDDAVSYAGWAAVDGRRVIELHDCFGPLLPTAEFDAPEALRDRLALLRGEGAPPARFRGIDALVATPAGGERGQSRRATLAVPASAPFFADHFPRRPVFPATLLLDAGIRLALELASELPAWPAGTPLRLVSMTRVKVRSFTPPGQRLDLTVSLQESARDRASIALAVSADEKSVATARVEIRAGAEENR